ncbi:MAG TPA: THUMP domain-containing protein, partial [Polyangiales bacterium]|nr:THUMP domain-containing protein [Polyangiales bacterium]
VHFGGLFSDAMRACYESRIAMRVLWRRGSFPAHDGDALYEGVRELDLSDVLTPAQSLSVSATVKNGELTHSGFVAQKVKDALVDAQRAQFGKRSDVDREDADVKVSVHVVRDQADLYLDLAGSPLHRRGYRLEAREAPIKETLAAAMLRLAGWDRQRPLIDPMCGSGTIAIEALLWARSIAPGSLRKGPYGFERWASHDARKKDALIAIREKARERVVKAGPEVLALDVDGNAVALTRKLAKLAGVDLRCERLDVRDFVGTDPPGHIVTNPPYGIRLERDESFDQELGAALSRLSGHRVSVICQDRELEDSIRAKPTQEHALWNGDLECRLFSWDFR